MLHVFFLIIKLLLISLFVCGLKFVFLRPEDAVNIDNGSHACSKIY